MCARKWLGKWSLGRGGYYLPCGCESTRANYVKAVLSLLREKLRHHRYDLLERVGLLRGEMYEIEDNVRL